MKRLHLLRLFCAMLLPFVLANCAASTPAKRIERRPAAFAALSADHQRLAASGQIKEGMNRDAVWIAWGPASQIIEVSDNGLSSEIWRYTGLTPIYRSSIGFGYHIGSVRHGRHRHTVIDPFWDYHYGPDYVPYTEAEVKFRKGLVKSWERAYR
jgi:hypothetical protein